MTAKLKDVTRVEMFDLGEKLKKGVDLKTLSDREVQILAHLRRQENVGKRMVPVGKLALRPGEELMDFVNSMMGAIQTNRVVLGDGSLDVWLQGIFEDFVVVQDFNTGRLFKAGFTRDEKGEFVFTAPVEVKTAFVEIAPPPAASDDVQRAVAKRAPDPVTFVDIGKRSTKWGNVLGDLGSR